MNKENCALKLVDEIILQNVCFDFLYNFCLKHFSFYVELSEIWSKMYIGLHVKYRLLLSDCNENWISFEIFSRNILISNFVKSRPAGAELLHPDGRTAVTKLILRFPQVSRTQLTRHPYSMTLCTAQCSLQVISYGEISFTAVLMIDYALQHQVKTPLADILACHFSLSGARLRHCATNQNVAGSIPDVTLIFHWQSFGRTMALGSTQTLKEMSTRNISWRVKAAWYVVLTTLPPPCADCLEIWEP